MNERERSELERLKQRHARLEQELASLGGQLRAIESRLQSPSEIAPKPAAPPSFASSSSEPWGPSAEPPPPSPIPESTSSAIPPVIDRVEQDPIAPGIGTRLTSVAGTPEGEPSMRAASEVPPAMAALDSAPEQSFEMRFGRHWAPRIGIVMVLTAFVFFANYAYQNFHMGAIGRVTLLYCGSAMLMAAGLWWQRKAAKASLKNYAQVLFAGGLAAVYFTTYAAHHIERLRVISSPIVDGMLLLGWAGFMVWIADRKKSEVLALFGVGLAYYTSVITEIESFTLYSNLLLTITAVFFLIRNRWAGLTFASLVATYLAYGYWRFYYGGEWHWATSAEGLWRGTYFLMSYWVVFTAAVFLSRHPWMSGPNRATFLTLNNGGFFVLFVLTMLQVHQGGFWKFAIIYGAVLLGLAETARHVLTAEPLSKNSYLTQGLVLVTVGIISHPRIAGLQLALLLGAESIVLLMLGFGRNNPILQIGAAVCGAMSVGWGIDSLVRDDAHVRNLAIAVGAMMAFNSFVAHRRGKANVSPVRAVPAFFAVMALMIWVAATWYNTSHATFPLALVLEGLVLSLSFHALRVREFVFLGQSCVLLGQFAWLLHIAAGGSHAPWWNPALIIGISVGLSYWWQWQKIVLSESGTASFSLAANGLVMGYRWGGTFLSLWWIYEYIPERERIWVLFFVGLVVFAFAGWRRNSEVLVFAAVYSLFGFVVLWWPLRQGSIAYLPNALAIFAWLAQQQIVRRMPQRYAIDHWISYGMIALGGASLWLLLYRWLHETAVTRSYMTASWSMLALMFFVVGMVLRERMYRWLGLAVLSCTLGRVFIFDVWRLGPLYRILSFLVLGIALLVLGFLYNRYQEKIREWL